MKLANMDVTIDGYEDPALEGENIIFMCSPESMLSGPNASTCMRSGEWEPHPKDVACAGSLVTTRGLYAILWSDCMDLHFYALHV